MTQQVAAPTIKRNQAPRFRVYRGSGRGKYRKLYEAIEKMEPGDWFEVPDSEALTKDQRLNMIRLLRDFIRRDTAGGIVVGTSDETGRVLVVAGKDGVE